MSLENEKEIQQLKNRIRDLAEKSYSQNQYTFTGFLGLAEQDALWQVEREVSYAGITLYGGREQAERKMLRFGSGTELGYEQPFPISCIRIRPLSAKFADKLSHRDYLGALMNLGIERSTIGDILPGGGEAFLFCQDTIAAFICENLGQIKHTHVKCDVVDAANEVPEEEPVKQVIQVASPRVDAVISKVYNKSRSDCLELFRAGKVYVNGRLCENNSKSLEQGDVVNARGYGKFRISGEPHATRKGKLAIETEVYP